MPIFLERGTAARGIDDHGIDIQAGKDGEVAPGAVAGGLEAAAMRVERAAAGLPGRSDDVVAGGIEQADAGGVRAAEHRAHHAAADKPDTTAARHARGSLFRERLCVGLFRHQREGAPKKRWQESIEAQSFQQARRAQDKVQPFWKWEHLLDGDTAKESLKEGTGVPLFNMFACGLQQRPVLDPARAGRFARATAQAEIDVAHGGIGEGEPPVVQRAHQVNPAARRIILVAGLEVGGT